jgi:hypothetical protein
LPTPWARWFEAEHEEQCVGIEAHLEDLDDEYVDYKALEKAHVEPLVPQAPPSPPVAVKEEEEEA